MIEDGGFVITKDRLQNRYSILIQEIRKLVMSGSETGTVYRVDGTLAEPGWHYGGVTKVSRRLSGKSSCLEYADIVLLVMS